MRFSVGLRGGVGEKAKVVIAQGQEPVVLASAHFSIAISVKLIIISKITFRES
jgi:competence protein ComGF